MAEGIAHTRVEQRRLQPTAAKLRDGGRTAEQGHAVMQTEHAGGARLAVILGEEARTILACGHYGAGCHNKVPQFRMFVCPASGVYVGPELRLLWTGNARVDVRWSCGADFSTGR